VALQFSSALRSAIADAVTAEVDGGAGAGKIEVYTGTLPSDLDPTGDTLLAEFTLTDPSAAAAAAGVATLDFDPDLSDTVLATGTAGYFLVLDSDDVAVFGGSVGTSGHPLNFSSVSFVSGGTVTLTTGTITAPATD
jgi:hypothetical protein